MKNKIKVIQYGLGPIGLKITKYISERNSIEIVGAIDISSEKVGKSLKDLAEINTDLNVKISSNAKEIFESTKADAVILTTTSSLEKIRPQVLEILSYKLNIISTCEELTHPWLTNSKIANEIDEAAKKNNVSVLATGVNPGFLMDFLPMSLTALCKDVKKVTVERIQNAQFRRLPFQQKIGAGLTPEQFQKKKQDGTLRHVGLTESVNMIASRLGWTLDKTEDIIEPVIASENTSAGELLIEKGNALGVKQIGKGIKNGEEIISLVFVAAVGQKDPRDRVIIEGTPNIDTTIKGGVNGDIATCAITVNAIPTTINAKAGLRTMDDIEPISCWV
ncbi:MAG: dihydrodipicolinate reductase [Ignavibacteriaceae bacterium]